MRLLICIILLISLSNYVVCSKWAPPNPLTTGQPVDLVRWKAHSSIGVDESVLEAGRGVSLSKVLDMKQWFNISQVCTDSLIRITEDLIKRKHYPIQMIDAWGKLDSGVLEGSFNWPGLLHECIDAKAPNFTAQYCTVQLGSNPFYKGIGQQVPLVRVGGCFPSNCSEADIDNILDLVVNKTTGTLASSSCLDNSVEWGAAEYTGVIVCSLLVFLVVLSTLYEYINIMVLSKGTDPDMEPFLNDPAFVQEAGKLHKLAISFSLITNTKILLNTEQKVGQIDCLHGMRFLSMSWVMLGHTLVFTLFNVDNVKFNMRYLLDHWEFQAVANATFSVDTFFFLSGLLVAYLGIRELHKREGKMNVLLMYLYRYMRLTPPYAFCILFIVSIFPMLGEGPQWIVSTEGLKNSCVKYWWGNLLYINNLYPVNTGQQCFAWGWYLANDTQFYILAPIFLFMFYRYPKTGISVATALITASMAITGRFSHDTNQQPQVVQMAQISNLIVNPPNSTVDSVYKAPPPNLYVQDIYMKPWCRLGAYLVGLLTGYLLQINNNKIRMSKVVVAVGWIFAAALNCAILYGLYPTVRVGAALEINTAAFYNAITRPLWCVGLAWVTVACVSGYGGPVNALLSWKAFIPLSRLTYCSYLVHPLIIAWLVSSNEELFHTSIQLFIMMFLATLVMSNLTAYVVSMLTEAPTIAIMKILLNKQSPPTSMKPDYDPSLYYNAGNLVVNPPA